MIRDFYKSIKFLGKRFWPFIIGILGMTAGYNSLSLVNAMLSKKMVDVASAEAVNTANSVTETTQFLLFFVGAMVILVPIFQYVYNRSTQLTYGHVKSLVFAKLLRMPVDFFENTHSGKITSLLINDVDKMCFVFIEKFRRTFAPLAAIVMYLIPMAVYNLPITVVFFVFNLICLKINNSFSKQIKDVSKEVQENTALMTEKSINILNGIMIVKMFGLDEQLVDEYKKANDAVVVSEMKRARIASWISAFNAFIYIFNSLIFLFVGNKLVAMGYTTYGDIIGIMTLQISVNFAFQSFGRYFPQIYEAFGATNRVYDYLQSDNEPETYQVPTLQDPAYIEFRNVSFAYENGREPVLRDFNMKVNNGETVAIVGESGSGKTTVGRLLLGFYPVSEGSIAVAGKTIGEMTLEELRDLIAYVPQDAYIYCDTIMENIRYGKTSATDEEVMAAAKIANAHNFIIEQPQGYQTIVGERGTLLSGGQRQRIAIARAILKDAPILLLDEATSALDSESESMITEAIEHLKIGRTTLIVAHRLSTIENADKVIRLEKIKL